VPPPSARAPGSAYILATTASTPLWGKLGDQFGRKKLFQASIVIFLIGSALCGQSHSMIELIAFRALQGLGGGGLIVLAQAIIGDVVPPRERGKYQALLTACRQPSAVRASVLHAYAQSIDRIFLFALPVAAAAFVLSWFLKEVPLRKTVGASDIGEGLGAASAQRSSVEEIERALVRLADGDMRRKGYERIAALAGLDMPAGSCWVLARLAKHGDAAGVELAREAGVTMEAGSLTWTSWSTLAWFAARTACCS
jgi:MFS family permease